MGEGMQTGMSRSIRGNRLVTRLKGVLRRLLARSPRDVAPTPRPQTRPLPSFHLISEILEDPKRRRSDEGPDA